jgi:squalene cyclase
MGLGHGVSFEGWLSSQLCVTAVAVEALTESGFTDRIGATLDLIRNSQTADGYWYSYWWSGNLYATVHCMKALKSGGIGEDARVICKAQDWVARTQLDDGSWGNPIQNGSLPFSTGLALSALMVEPRPDLSGRIAQGIDWLLDHQLSDGSWAPGHILRIPHPSVKEPWNESFWRIDGKAINAVIKDHRRIFSTATVFTALSDSVGKLSRSEVR